MSEKLKWESVYVEKVTCCGRVISAGFELPGEKKKKGPEYGNTTFERHFQPGDHTKGRWMCSSCPRIKVGKITVFPSECERGEAAS